MIYQNIISLKYLRCDCSLNILNVFALFLAVIHTQHHIPVCGLKLFQKCLLLWQPCLADISNYVQRVHCKFLWTRVSSTLEYLKVATGLHCCCALKFFWKTNFTSSEVVGNLIRLQLSCYMGHLYLVLILPKYLPINSLPLSGLG